VDISNKNFSSFLNSFISEKKKLLIAVSGGIDSQVLLHLCLKNIPLAQLHAIHVNHNLTVEASTYEDFVKKECFKMNIPLIIESEKMNASNGESMEMWGRRVRYRNYFKRLKDLNFDYTLTAHHANDNIETILMNIDRGCFVKGLRGVVPKNGQIVRPLLNYKKSDIISYAKKNCIDFIHDSSNDDVSIKRNYVRKYLVTKLMKQNSSIIDRFSEISRKAQNAIFKEKIIMELFASKIEKDRHGCYHLDDKELLSFNIYFKMRIIKEIIGEANISWRRYKYNSLRYFIIKSKTGSKLQINNTWLLLRDRGKWILSKNISKKIKININRFGFHNFNNGAISFKKTDKRIFTNNANIEIIDLDKVKNKDIQIRNWISGDKFQPLGMKGNKKVSDYLIDKKVDCISKENQLVMTADDEIIWLCGQRLSDKVRITNNTNNMMELSIFK